MKVKILFFGSLEDVADGKSEIQLDNVHDIDSVKKILLEKYPALSDYTFRIAVNQQILSKNQTLNDNDVVALLPPFAGG